MQIEALGLQVNISRIARIFLARCELQLQRKCKVLLRIRIRQIGDGLILAVAGDPVKEHNHRRRLSVNLRHKFLSVHPIPVQIDDDLDRRIFLQDILHRHTRIVVGCTPIQHTVDEIINTRVVNYLIAVVLQCFCQHLSHPHNRCLCIARH